MLDNTQLYQKLDPSGMEARIAGLPNQCRQAWEKALSVELPSHYRRAKSVVVVGMGGSAIGVDLVSDLSLHVHESRCVHEHRGVLLSVAPSQSHGARNHEGPHSIN